MKRRAAGLALALLTGACTLPPLESEQLSLSSRDYKFLDQLFDASAVTGSDLEAYLLVPEGSGPFPAVVLLHGSQGQGTQDRHYAELLQASGYAALAVDSFSARGVERTIKDPTLVSETAMMADAYAGLRALARDPRIDPQRIALLGFSKGGVATVYSAFTRYAERLAPGGERFAAHVAFYPWCGLTPFEPRTTGAPLLILAGAADPVAPPDLCKLLLDLMLAADPELQAEMSIYPHAGHAFDHPLLDAIPLLNSLPVVGQLPTNCRFVETAPGLFVERRTGQAVAAATLSAVLKDCSTERAEVVGDPVAAVDAEARLLSFLATALR